MKKNILITVLLITQFSCFTSNLNLETNPKEKINKSDHLYENLKTQKDNSELETVPSPSESNSQNSSNSTSNKRINDGELVVSEPECVKEEYPDLPNDWCREVKIGGFTNIPLEEIGSGRPTKYDFERCTYFRNEPIPDIKEEDIGYKLNYIQLIFRDEAKIRWDDQKKEFFSLNCSDVSNINRIIQDNVYKFFFRKSTKEDETVYRNIELRKEKLFKYDVTNSFSEYKFFHLDKNYKKFIEEFRKDPNVRLMNLIQDELGETS